MRKIWKSELVRNSAKLLSANVLAQVIGLVVYPILTRLYSPEDFGLLNLFLSLGGVLTILATAEYQYAIVLPKQENDARAVMGVGGVILFFVSIVLVPVTLILNRPICNLLGAPEFSVWLMCIPVFVLLGGMWSLLNYWFTRKKQFGQVAEYQLTQSILSSLVKVGMGLQKVLPGGLITGTMLGQGLAMAGVLIRSRELGKAREKSKDDLTMNLQDLPLKRVAKEYRKFPMYSLPRAVVNNLSGNLPAFVLTPFFGLGELGYFAMAMTLAFRPLNMISGSLYQTFYQRTAEAVNNRQTIWPFFRKFITYTLLIVCPAFAALYFVLPWLTALLLGDGWEQTGELIRVMLPWLMMVTIGASISFVPDIFGKQHISAVIEVLYLVLRILALGLGVWMNSFYMAIVAYSVVGTVVIGGQIIWYWGMIRRYDQHL